MKKLIKAIFIIVFVALAGVGLVTIGNSLGIVDKIKSEIDKHTSSLCEHEWVDATCELPRTCDKCGKTKGESLGHDFIAGVCYRCGALEGGSDGGKDSSSALPDSSIEPDISVPDDCEHDILARIVKTSSTNILKVNIIMLNRQGLNLPLT